MTAQSATVLIVDDEASLRHLLGQFLRMEGYTILNAAGGEEGLGILRTTPVDLVLLDMFMPGMTGLEVLARMKADPALTDIPVVMISADQDLDGVANCLKLGADDYLPKPFRPVILAARVSTSLERRRLRTNERAYQARLEAQVQERTAALAASEAALRRQSRLLASILNSISDGVVVVDTDGKLIHHNPAAEAILGAQIGAVLPQQADLPTPLYHAEHHTPLLAGELPLAHAIRRETVTDVTASFSDSAAAQRWINISAQPLIDDEQTVTGGVAVVRDVSAARQAEIALRESEERYMLAARGANDGLWDWDLRANRAYFSPRWKLMLGYEDHEIGANPAEWLDRIHPDDRERVEVHLAAHYQRLITHFQHEYRILHKDGNYRWMLCRGLAVWDTQGRAIRVAGSQTDISDRKHAEERLLHDALHDWLTGLPNRMLFQDRLEHALGRNRRNPNDSFAVIFLDLDRFKVINDSLGHAVGDLLLKTVARRIEGCVRPGDTVARLGGDEFTILLEDVGDEATALAITSRLQEVIAEPLSLDDQEVFTTASIGVTLSTLNYASADDLIRDADTAMYHAKVRGKARAVVFDPAMHAAAMHLLQIESALRWALQRNELRVHYQPIVALETGLVVGFEALVRWLHPERGLLLPGEFIGIAEETGLIVPIGWWVLHEACRQMVQWQQTIPEAAELWVTVNISVKQLIQADILDQIRFALRETGLAPAALRLEITESMLIEHSERVAAILDQIRTLGIRVSMDDFGTGYSSLSYLQRLPVDALKIDRSFINQLGITQERSEIVKAILSLAHAMGLQAVAEGTETVEQVEYLRAHSCELGQGWLYAKALDPSEISALVGARQPLGGHPPHKTPKS